MIEKIISLTENRINNIEAEIRTLFLERRSLLEQLDRPYRTEYTVFNNGTGLVEPNLFVMNPIKERDRKYIREYVEGSREGTTRDRLLEWLDEYDKYRCIRKRVCKISKTPVCCAHCLLLNECMLSGKVCSAVEIGEVLNVADCIDED